MKKFGNLFFLIISSSSQWVFASDNLFITNSWTEIHKAANEVSSAVTQATVNTPITLIEKKTPWCLIETEEKIQGYVQCSAIGNKKITEAKDPMMQFWLTPSLANWENAGHFLEKNLTDEQRQAESETGQSQRMQVPEFDAMKKRVEKDLSVPFSAANADQFSVPNNLLVKDKVPLKPSFFKNSNEYLFLTTDSTSALDQKIAFSKGTAKVISISPIAIGGDNNYPEMAGFWDVGQIKIKFEKPLYFYKIASNGLVDANTEIFAESDLPNMGCVGAPLYEAKFANHEKGTAHVEESIANFYLAAPFTATSVNVYQTFKLVTVKNSIVNISQQVKEKTYLIDLDLDSNPDIKIINTYSIGNVNGTLLSSWYRFINLKGEWVLVDYNYDVDCT